MGVKMTEEKATWRLHFIVEVFASEEAEATEIAKRIYEDYAGPIKQLDGVRWLLPVATVKERDF